MIQEVKDNIKHAVAAIKIGMLHPVYLNMVTARLLTNCSNTLRNIHNDTRENIRRTRAKRKVGYFFLFHPVQFQCLPMLSVLTYTRAILLLLIAVT